eukprot:scaffold8111_cov206-Skeletonema_marinoi.AAC.16
MYCYVTAHSSHAPPLPPGTGQHGRREKREVPKQANSLTSLSSPLSPGRWYIGVVTHAQPCHLARPPNRTKTHLQPKTHQNSASNSMMISARHLIWPRQEASTEVFLCSHSYSSLCGPTTLRS